MKMLEVDRGGGGKLLVVVDKLAAVGDAEGLNQEVGAVLYFVGGGGGICVRTSYNDIRRALMDPLGTPESLTRAEGS